MTKWKLRVYKWLIIIGWLIIIILIIFPMNIGSYLGNNVEFTEVEKIAFIPPALNNTNLAIRSIEDYRDIWNDNVNNNPPEPMVDFNESIVIVVYWELKPSGKYSIEISKITEFNDKIVVYVTKHEPNPGGGGDLSTTHPIDVVKIDQTDKPIEFEDIYLFTYYGINVYYLAAIILLIILTIITYEFIRKLQKIKVLPTDK